MTKETVNLKHTGALLLFMLIIMAGLIYLNGTESGVGKDAFKELKSLTLEGQLEAAEKNSYVCNVDELMVEATGAVVTARNIKGDIVWSKTFLSPVALMKGSASRLYVVDNSKNLYSISKLGKPLWDKQLEGEVYNLLVDKTGDILIDMRSPKGSKIQIISGEGVAEGSVQLESSAVVAFASGDGENTISVVDISSQILKTRIITLDLKGAIVWSDNIDDQVVPILSYGKDNTLIAVGEKAIYKYKGESKKLSKLELNKTIYSASVNNTSLVAVVRSRWGFDVISYDLNFKELGSFSVEKAPKGIILGKDNYILYYNESLLVYNLKASAKGQYKSIPSINNVTYSDEGNIILLSDRMLQKLNFR